MHRRVASLWAACLILLFCVGGATAQERTDLVDAPLWPLFLGGPLKTIALEVNATGDLPRDFAVSKVELECLAHLRAALAAISDIKVVRHIDVVLNREMPSDGIMVVVKYSVTLKAGRHAQSGEPVLIGAADWDVRPPNRRLPDVAVYSPPELFLIEPTGPTLHETVVAVINAHVDRYVVGIVKAGLRQ